MTVRFPMLSAGALLCALAAAGCEPSTITAARDQLARGALRTMAFTLPISSDTVRLAKVLGSDTATTAGGLLGIRLDTQRLSSAVGQQLKFDALNFQQFRFSYAQMLTAAPDSGQLTFTFAPPFQAGPRPMLGSASLSLDTLRFVTPGGSAVSGATIATGSAYAQLTNNTTCSAIISETLRDSTGAVVATFPARTVSAGATITDTVDVTGATFQNYLYLGSPSVTPTGPCVPVTGTTVAVKLSTPTLALASVSLHNLNETFSQTDSVLANEPRIGAVDSVTVLSGSFTLTIQNRLPVAASVTIRLDGVTRGGVPLTTTALLPAAPGDGTARTSTVTLDLANTLIRPKAVVATVSGVASAASATITAQGTTDAVVVDGSGSLVIQSLAGSLDPARTPELTVGVQEFTEIAHSQVDRFGDLKDAMKGAHLDDATATVRIVNQAQTPIVLSNVTLGVVRLDAGGNLLRDGSGNPAYEQDSTTHLPILVRLAHTGQTADTLARGGTSTLTLQMAPLADRLIHLLLDDTRAAVVAAGNAVAGDGLPSRITRADSVKVTVQLIVGLDVTLPDTGVVFTRTEWTGGADLKPADSATVVDRLTVATGITDVVNGSPFGVTADVAIVRDSVADTVDLFAVPGHVALGPVVLAGSPVDANGLVTTPATSSQSVSLSGLDARALLGKKFTTRIRLRLKPPPGGTGRGALRPTDAIIVRSHASIELHAGGAQ